MDVPLKKEVLTNEDLQQMLSGKKFILSCGHRATIGHNFSNTVVIISDGGGRIHTLCHSCYL